ncbi:MAG TPA: hypothetical protein VLI39_18780 [Sedimentisphaerales bacterium]|nr:hypothetical protein [Sedimentisphaerales bacterium]
MNRRETTRRQFLVTGASGVSACIAFPAVLQGVSTARAPVWIGHIGTGTRGWDLIKCAGTTDTAKVAAVCDVYKPHMRRGVEAAGIQTSEPARTIGTCSPIRRWKR